MKTQIPSPKIVVVGGGFAGLATVQTLLKNRIAATITLISDKEYLTYYPALYSLVTENTQTQVALPFTTLFKEGVVYFQKGTFTMLDQARQIVSIATETGQTELPYDYLVLALGSQANYFNIPGLEKCSLSFKSVDEALKLKSHFETLLANAKNLPKNDSIATLHTVIVGGGPSGVEIAGTLKHYLASRAKVHGIDTSMITVDLIEGSPRLLPMMSEKVSQLAEDRLRALGVNIFTNRILQSEDEDEAILNDMDIKTGTVIWTAGTRINEVYMKLPGIALSEKKRIVVTDTLALTDDNHIFIAGDGAATEYSGLAQTAIYDGNYVGTAIARLLENKTVAPYVARKPSFVIPVGKNWAIFVHRSMVFTGLFPSLLRRLIDWKYRFSVQK